VDDEGNFAVSPDGPQEANEELDFRGIVGHWQVSP
jgi:hypothetical protein